MQRRQILKAIISAPVGATSKGADRLARAIDELEAAVKAEYGAGCVLISREVGQVVLFVLIFTRTSSHAP